jgi:two-component system phosphate regulon sensor histidine kinase PhoR
VYAFRDLTEQLRFEETRSDFVATVSHELRTPLASIHGAASTLSQRNDRLSEKTRRQLLEIVSEQSERLTDLVDQILLANQLAAGTVHVDRQSFEPERVARSVLEGVRPGLPPHVALDLQAPLGLPLALGDPENTRRVLVNLVENAVKYSPRGGRIDVRIEEHDGQVRFVVRDRGLGIPAAEQERIFEKFYRLDPGMRGGIGGSGLGLYICRELASLMDGRLTVDSSPGRGSSFTFELPVAQAVSAAS